MQFQFNQQPMFQNLVEIEQIGEFGLEAWNDEGYYFYLVIKTLLGTSVIATCGPVVPDIDVLPSGYKAAMDKTPYKEEKLIKIISNFLNDRYKCLTHANVIPVNEAISQFKELKYYLSDLSMETF